jgi:hypothetical protein
MRTGFHRPGGLSIASQRTCPGDGGRVEGDRVKDLALVALRVREGGPALRGVRSAVQIALVGRERGIRDGELVDLRTEEPSLCDSHPEQKLKRCVREPAREHPDRWLWSSCTLRSIARPR